MAGNVPRRHSVFDCGVEDPGAVKVELQAMLVGKVPGGSHIRHGQGFAPLGVFQAKQAGLGKMDVVGFDFGGGHGQINCAVGLEFDGLGLNTAEHCRPATFVFIGVGQLADQILIATLAMGHEGDEVRLGSAAGKKCGGKAEELSADTFQFIDGWVFAIDIIADCGGHHCLTHGGGWLGDGITTEIYGFCRHWHYSKG